MYDLYEKAHTPWEWHKPIMKRANELGMLCFSSPFDESAVDFLEDLNVPAYKIASFENNHLPLIKKASSTGKPIIISTGMATVSEIHEAVVAARESGCKDLILLKCTSTYPATPESSNILTILAINTGRFRGDLESLARAGFEVYMMPYKWQTRIFYAYKDRKLKSQFRNPPVNSSIHRDRDRVRKYLSHLLELVFLKKNIDCIIGAGLFYNQDIDWGAAAVTRIYKK